MESHGWGTVPYLQYFSISVQNVHGDLDVLLNALPSSLELSSLQGQVQVVPDVTWDDTDTFTENNGRTFPPSCRLTTSPRAGSFIYQFVPTEEV